MTAFSRLGGESMGTSWSVVLDDPSGRDLQTLHAAVEECLDLVIAQMSTWEPNSEISRFNAAPAGTWQTISKEFSAVLESALDIARRSGGAFDPAIGRLVALWGFGADAQSADPVASLDDTHLTSNFRWLRFDPASNSICQPGGLQLDLSATAKGFSADLVAMRLQELGVSSALVEVGGELYAFGESPRGGAWNVLLETGADEDEALPEPRVVALSSDAVATSGDRWFRHERNERLVSHSLDPRTGEPIDNDVAAVTVICDCAMKADAWATALTVMGGDQGMAFATEHGIAARFVTRVGEGAQEHCSPAFERFIVR